MNELADRIDAAVRASIAGRGGTGRRLSRIMWELLNPMPDEDEFSAAIESLVTDNRGRLTSPDGFPMWIYYEPVEAP